MDKYIYKSQVITYSIVLAAILVIFGVWPFGFIHKSHVAESIPTEITASEPATEESVISQVFVADGNRLEHLDVLLVNESEDADVTELGQLDLAIYDGEFNRLYHKVFTPKKNDVTDGYIRIRTSLGLDRGMPYIFSLYGTETGVRVGLEDHYSTSNLSLFTVNFAGNEDPDHNVCSKLKFSTHFAWWQTIIIELLILIIALISVYAVLVYYGKMQIPDRIGFLKSLSGRGADVRMSLQKVVACAGNPLIILLSAISLYFVFPKKTFSDAPDDIAIMYAGIILFALLLLYVINRKRETCGVIDLPVYIKDHVRTWIISGSLAVMIWKCFEYMNGLYDIDHAYASRRVLIWFFIAIIATFGKKQLLNIPNVIWAIFAPAGFFVYLHMNPVLAEDMLLYKLTCGVILMAGFMAINVILTIIGLFKGRVRAAVFDKPYLILTIVFAIGIVALSNTRTWPIQLVSMMAVLAFRLCFYEDRNRWTEYLCNGIILNFLAMMVFSLLHRPYYGYIYHRYNMSYFTVTMTATHLTLCLAAVSVRLYIRYRQKKDLRSIIPDMMLFGAVACYLIMTLSRTGYASAVAMMVIGLMAAVLFCEKKSERLRSLAVYVIAMLAATAIMFPVIFTATRTIPAVVNDPVIYEYEPCIVTISKGTEPDNENYMTVHRFIEVFKSKVLNVGDSTASIDMEYGLQNTLKLASMADISSDTAFMILLATDDEYKEEQEDVTNGRISIYRSYIEQSNLWGHDSMGAILEDGSEAAHAHNVFLQVIYDHGIVFGIYFIIFVGLSLLYGTIRIKSNRTEDYDILITVLMAGFIVAGMVEWIFHACSPYGLTAFLALIPMLFKANDKVA